MQSRSKFDYFVSDFGFVLFWWSNEFLVASCGPDDEQNVHEQVDDVQIEVEGGEDVLFGVEGVLVLPAEHQLSVVDDEQGEDQRAESTVSDHGVLVVGDEDHDDAADEQDDHESAHHA